MREVVFPQADRHTLTLLEGRAFFREQTRSSLFFYNSNLCSLLVIFCAYFAHFYWKKSFLCFENLGLNTVHQLCTFLHILHENKKRDTKAFSFVWQTRRPITRLSQSDWLYIFIVYLHFHTSAFIFLFWKENFVLPLTSRGKHQLSTKYTKSAHFPHSSSIFLTLIISLQQVLILA